MAPILAIGQKFQDFSTFVIAIRHYQESENVQFFKRSSRSISAAQPRISGKKLNEQLKYYEVTIVFVAAKISNQEVQG